MLKISGKFMLTEFSRKSGMKSGSGFESGQLEYELQAIGTAVRGLAEGYQGDSLALLALLRRLEELHRELRDGIFQASLPDNRQALYKLLKDIEAKGGWPYIERMKLQSFLANLPADATGEASVSLAMGVGDLGANVESQTD